METAKCGLIHVNPSRPLSGIAFFDIRSRPFHIPPPLGVLEVRVYKLEEAKEGALAMDG